MGVGNRHPLKQLITILVALLITGCQSTDPLSTKNDPRSPWWELAFAEPNYMKVWVEDTAVQDIKGETFLRTGGGSASGGQPEDGTDSARGWHGVGSTGKAVVGADLPKRIYVRWQSIAEPQTYKVWVDIPEEARNSCLSPSTSAVQKHLNNRGVITRLSTWAWRPVVSCKSGSGTHATILSKSPEHRQRLNR
jgi:hypothetical protein